MAVMRARLCAQLALAALSAPASLGLLRRPVAGMGLRLGPGALRRRFLGSDEGGDSMPDSGVPAAPIRRVPATSWKPAYTRMAAGPGDDVFFSGAAGEATVASSPVEGFADYGVCDEVCEALAAAGITAPSRIQALALPYLAEPRSGLTEDGNPYPHMVLGAETGSGKTLAYLIPILHRFVTQSDPERDASYPFAVVLVANKELAVQAEKMAKDVVQHLKLPDGKELRVGSLTNAEEDWPYSKTFRPAPDVLITLPIHLARYDRGDALLDVLEASRILVLDEADLLLDAHHLKQVDRVLTAVKRVNRKLNPRFAPVKHAYRNPKPAEDTGEQTVQVVLAAATLPSRGLKSIDADINKRFREGIVRVGLASTRASAPMDAEGTAAPAPRADGMNKYKATYIHEHHPLITQRWVWVGRSDEDGDMVGVEIRTAVLLALLQGTSPDENTKRNLCDPKTLVRSLQAFDPAYEVSDAADILDTIGCLNAESAPDAAGFECLQTLVFVNTVGAATLVEGVLERAGVKVAGYHKNIRFDERLENLEKFREGEAQVMICTDLASRGLDLPNVQQVVELEFALNVVNHLHRQGRAARAGREGMAYSLYDVTSQDLVHSIKTSIEKRGTVDSTFSRNRSFRKRVRKGTQDADLHLEDES